MGICANTRFLSQARPRPQRSLRHRGPVQSAPDAAPLPRLCPSRGRRQAPTHCPTPAPERGRPEPPAPNASGAPGLRVLCSQGNGKNSGSRVLSQPGSCCNSTVKDKTKPAAALPGSATNQIRSQLAPAAPGSEPVPVPTLVQEKQVTDRQLRA